VIRIVRWTALAVMVAATSCDSGPKAGEIVAELVTPQQALGAAMFRVNAIETYAIDSVTAACSGCRAFMSRVSEREVRGVVTGSFSAGPLLRVMVSDRDARSSYSVLLLQLAAPTYEIVPLGGSSLTFPAPQ